MTNDTYRLFQTLSHGVYVIGVGTGNAVNAFTASWVMQASFKPLMLALSINHKHRSFKLLQDGRVFTVNVLPCNRLDLAEHFGRPAQAGKLNQIEWVSKVTGAPILMAAMSYFECRMQAQCHAGDHVVVTGEVIDGVILDAKGTPMTYQQTGEMDGSRVLYPDTFLKS